MKRLVCVHGHFYQPPREDPWTGVTPLQPTAAPDHDWNERVARECYLPNGEARVVDSHGRVLERVNNYEHLSFDFGPTLLSWLERAHPEGYRRILEADRKSLARLGHGNAIAQGYNHAILPLCSPRDLETQLVWGLADFERRFGREAEALWLPETAASPAVLSALIRHKMKYAILAPGQAARVRPIGSSEWTQNIDTRRPYLWREPAGRGGLALFFYDGALSHGVAFDKALAHAPAFAERLLKASGREEGALLSIATDGESYGHHSKFLDMGLAHLMTRDLPHRRLEVVNYAAYLAAHPPRWEAELAVGPRGRGTSWSCVHGVARWMEDCACGAEGARGTAWRRPLREAVDWLRDELAEVFERRGGELLEDPWEARDAYIAVILDASQASVESFLAARLRDPGARRRALAFLEMQRFALLMQTSCAWFFAHLSGIEAAQNLRYAARALELAREAAGMDLEDGFLARLRRAADGERIWKTATERT